MGLSAERCPACERPGLDEPQRRRVREMSTKLAGAWASAPYFRSAEGVSYTPRRQLRGFLTELRHPLGEAMLQHLFSLALLASPGELRRVMYLAQQSLPSEASRLAQSLRHLFRDHEPALAAVGGGAGSKGLSEAVVEGASVDDSKELAAAYRDWRDRDLSGAG